MRMVTFDSVIHVTLFPFTRQTAMFAVSSSEFRAAANFENFSLIPYVYVHSLLL